MRGVRVGRRDGGARGRGEVQRRAGAADAADGVLDDAGARARHAWCARWQRIGAAAAAFFVAAPYTILDLPGFLDRFASLTAEYRNGAPPAEAGIIIYLKHCACSSGCPGCCSSPAGCVMGLVRAVRGPGRVPWAVALRLHDPVLPDRRGPAHHLSRATCCRSCRCCACWRPRRSLGREPAAALPVSPRRPHGADRRPDHCAARSAGGDGGQLRPHHLPSTSTTDLAYAGSRERAGGLHAIVQEGNHLTLPGTLPRRTHASSCAS